MNLDIANYLLLVFKAFFVMGAVVYFIFSIVVVKQTTMMTKNVNDKFNPILVTFSLIHAVFAGFLILLTLFAL